MKFVAAAVTLCVVASLGVSSPIATTDVDNVLASMGFTPSMSPAQLKARAFELVQNLEIALDDLVGNIADFDAVDVQAALTKAKGYFDFVRQQLDFATRDQIYNGYRITFQMGKVWIAGVLEEMGFELTEEMKAKLSAKMDEEFAKVLSDFKAETAAFSDEELKQRVRDDIEQIETTIDAAYTYVALVDLTEVVGFVEGLKESIREAVQAIPEDYAYDKYKEAAEYLLNFLNNLPIDLGL